MTFNKQKLYIYISIFITIQLCLVILQNPIQASYNLSDRDLIKWANSFTKSKLDVIQNKKNTNNGTITQQNTTADSDSSDDDINQYAFFIGPTELFGKNYENKIDNNEFLDKFYNLLSQSNSIDYQYLGKIITKLRNKITSDTKNYKLRIALSIYEYLAGDLYLASTEAKRAIAIMPNSYLPHLMIGLIFNEINQNEYAISEIKRAIYLLPNQCYLHEYLAKAYLNAGDISACINQLRRSISIRPRSNPLAYLSYALLMAKDNIGALKAARLSESLNHSNPLAYIALSHSLLANDEKESALRTARLAILLNPMLAQSHIVLGEALAQNNQTKKALDELEQAVELEPLNSQARNDYGVMLYQTKDPLAAITQYKYALRLNPNLTQARNNLKIAIYSFDCLQNQKTDYKKLLPKN